MVLGLQDLRGPVYDQWRDQGQIHSGICLRAMGGKVHSPGSKQTVSAGAGEGEKMHRQYSSN